jgi:hypothetical protein
VEQHTEVFVGLDVAKARHAVAVAEDGRQGEVRYIGEIGADTDSVRRLVTKLEKRHGRLHFATRPVRPAMGCIASSPSWVTNAPSSRHH